MAEAHYHLIDNTSVIERDDDAGINELAQRAEARMDEGEMITFPGLPANRVELIKVNPDHVVKIMFVAD